MFEQTFVDTHTRARQPWTLAASATVQTGLVGLLLLIPLLHPEGPLLRLDTPPVIYRPVTVIQPPPPTITGTRPTRATSLLFSPILRAPPRISTRIVSISDAPEFTGPVSPFQVSNPFIGAIPDPVVPPPTTRVAPAIVETPPPPTAPLRVSTSVQSALLIFGPKPVYPPLAKAARVQGTVRLQAIIATDGNIRNLRLMSGPPLLVKSALDAVQRWRYRATMLNGTPVEVSTEVEVKFTLTQ